MRPALLARLWAVALCWLPLQALADPFAYAAGFSDLYRIDLASGATTLVGPIGFNDVEGLAIGPDGALYGVVDQTQGTGSATTDFLIRIDPTSGQGNLLGALGLAGRGPGGNLDYGLAFTCDGRLWAASDTTQELWEVNPSTGSTRLVGTTGAAISGLAGLGPVLYGVSVGANPSLFRINPETATASVVSALNIGGVVDDAGLDFANDGTLWAVLDPEPAAVGVSRVARIDPATGQATVVANVAAAVGMEALALARVGTCTAAEAVPAAGAGSSTALLLLTALVAGVALRRRQTVI